MAQRRQLTGDLTGPADLTGGFDRARPALTRQRKQWELPSFSNDGNDGNDDNNDNDDPPSHGQLSISPSVVTSPGGYAETKTGALVNAGAVAGTGATAGTGLLFFVSFVVTPVLIGVVALLFL